MGVLCMQIKATLVCSVFDILFGVAQLTTASIGVAMEMFNNYNYHSDWVVQNHSIHKRDLKLLVGLDKTGLGL